MDVSSRIAQKCANERGVSQYYSQQAALLHSTAHPPPLGRLIPDAPCFSDGGIAAVTGVDLIGDVPEEFGMAAHSVDRHAHCSCSGKKNPIKSIQSIEPIVQSKQSTIRSKEDQCTASPE
jgi:hypothetical protein